MPRRPGWRDRFWGQPAPGQVDRGPRRLCVGGWVLYARSPGRMFTPRGWHSGVRGTDPRVVLPPPGDVFGCHNWAASWLGGWGGGAQGCC